MDVRISKKYTFEAAHQLTDHSGKCANLHGHSYHLEVWVKGPRIVMPGHTSDGMVMDYADLDIAVKPLIDKLDHSFVFKGDESAWTALWDQSVETKVTDLGVRTTAENLAEWFWMNIVSKLPGNIRLMGVVVSETEKTSAEYIGEVHHASPA